MEHVIFDLQDIARRLIAIDSRSSLSDQPVIDLLAPLCRDVGLEVRTQSEERDGCNQYNLIAVRRAVTAESLDGALLLNTHLDTVPPGDPALWTACHGDPFAATVSDGYLYGLGVADVKLDFLCKLTGLSLLRDVPLQRPVILAGTYGEETGRWGAKLLARELRPLPVMALVGEPSGLRPATAHKGYVEIHIVGEGVPQAVPEGPCWQLHAAGAAAHSSQPHKGRSANDLLLDFLSTLPGTPVVVDARGGELVNNVAAAASALLIGPLGDSLPDGITATAATGDPPTHWQPDLVRALLDVHASIRQLREDFAACPEDGFQPPVSTINSGLLELTPGHLRLVSDVRSLPGDGPAQALAAHLARIDQISAAAPCAVRRKLHLQAAPFRARADSPLVAALEAALQEHQLPLTRECKSGTTEATVYSDAGIDTVVFGPGEATGNIHRPNERMPLRDLETASRVYASVVRRLCG